MKPISIVLAAVVPLTVLSWTRLHATSPVSSAGAPNFQRWGKAEGGGSGWVLLMYSPRDKRLVNQWAADHTNAIAGGQPAIALDMYEHAYHMDYGAKAGGYVDAFMEAINWDNAVKFYDRHSRAG
jgi:Fe-Mn family superoxide dismutase